MYPFINANLNKNSINIPELKAKVDSYKLNFTPSLSQVRCHHNNRNGIDKINLSSFKLPIKVQKTIIKKFLLIKSIEIGKNVSESGCPQ